ncbi:MAG: hypothetical protein KY450_02735 [Actinobacteria bacterium]|nr:hypothetical protein [Actinomycetota bacterium]
MARAMPFHGDLLHLPGTLCLSIGVTLTAGASTIDVKAAERTLAASPRHTFADLAMAIDEAFGRWELGDRRAFTLGDGTRVGEVAAGRPGSRRLVDYRHARLHRLRGEERFVYILDSGERLVHDCVLIGSIDPSDVLADRPGHPVCFSAPPEVLPRR